MNYDNILQKQKLYAEKLSQLPAVSLDSYRQAFDIEYTHDSTAIEGNTLSLIETKVVIEDGISVGGKALREIYEVINHHKAFKYVRKCIDEKLPLDERIVKDIHSILMENIFVGGIYRNVEVRISGAKHAPPNPSKMFTQIKDFYADLAWKSNQLNPIEFAAWTHAEFVKIHPGCLVEQQAELATRPFEDGNGRTSRLIMNYQLMSQGFLPVSISKENRLTYFDALEKYAIEDDLSAFAHMIAELEEVQLDRYLEMAVPEIKEDNGQSML